MAAIALLGLLVACTHGDDVEAEPQVPATARLLFAGDAMLGRGLAAVVANDPGSVFEDLRTVVASATFAAVNLESPLTSRPVRAGQPHDLRAGPAAATLLAGAGFDAVTVANNHALDSGPQGLADTVAAARGAGLEVSGPAGRGPVVVDAGGLKVALLAFDVSTPSTAGDVIARWDPEAARTLVEAARGRADVVTVSIHGAYEVSTTDPVLAAVAASLVSWGVDVVWGHGSHAVQPTLVDDGPRGPAVVATSLGNLVFDQGTLSGRRGAVLEVLVDRAGVVAHRLGGVEMSDRRAHFAGWSRPAGDAVLLDRGWWQADRPAAEVPAIDTPPLRGRFGGGQVVAAGIGDLDRDGEPEAVVSFRRPHRPNLITDEYPGVAWVDAEGRSAHVGVYRLTDLAPRWVAGSVPRPVGALAVCDAAVGVVYTSLDSPLPTGAGGWTWTGFGFELADDLEGSGLVSCVDLDGDGRTEPLVSGRPTPASP